MKKEYLKPNIGFTAFKSKTHVSMELNASDPIMIDGVNMDPNSFKIQKLN